MNRVLALVLVAVLFVPRGAPAQDDVVLIADPGFAFPVLRGWSIAVAFGPFALTNLSPAQIRDGFPAEHAGGTRVEWGVRSPSGLQVDFAFARPFDRVEFFEGEPAFVSPPALLGIVEGGPEIEIDGFVVRSPVARVSETSGDHLSIFPGIVLSHPVASPNPSWTATFDAEFFCRYEDAAGLETGVLVGADVGLPSATGSLEWPGIPVRDETASFGALKERFRD